MKTRVLLGPLLLLVIWSIVATSGWISPLFLVPPWDVAMALLRLGKTGAIFLDVGSTLYRLGVGLTTGIVLGIAIGIAVGYSQRLYSSLEVLIDFFRSVPVAALIPLFLLFFGIGDRAKMATAGWATCLIVLVNTTYGVRNCRIARLMIARTMKANWFQTLLKVVLPDSMPQIVAGVRTALSIALIVVVATEMLMGTKAGLGKRIFDSSMTYSIGDMYAAILLTGALGYCMNKLFVMCERRLVHWSGR